MALPWLNSVEQQLAQSYKAQRFHHAQLLCGPIGVGKFELSEQLANSLLCQNINTHMQRENSTLSPCGQCKSCALTHAGNHPDKRLTQVEGQSIGVDDIRAISDFMNHSAAQNGNKVAIIENCEKMTTAAANALLKTLEEPSNSRFLILTTSNTAQLPATILSRCAKTDIKVTNPNEAKSWLANLNINDHVWLPLFYTQPLLIKQWQAQEQLQHIDTLYKFATEFKQSHNFSPLVNIINKQPELIRIFTLFLSEQLKQQLIKGLSFDAYQSAQQAVNEFLQNSTEVLGLNLPLAVSRLAHALRHI
ncbi:MULTISPECIES: DNA polymerase III subunit [Pseudoalteromonas]|uniref:DNA polymerase III subunit n=1 Tax=Pseudoalteromonas undina TaxID=43660 RepID=A0ACC6R1L9_9GAMM|nr:MULTISPECIES: DNA polymerase III subunit [unclassified Pseudoalteromonas]KPZ53581.1 DNA polymerase III subunit delta' [Pseudoalteromonas sp. P1-25]KPZ53713.1 DNA polymerase III subunit delta' [Pseudoalteromonas sp. P1-7a]